MMLLGSEYVLLSKIASEFTLHNDMMIRIPELNNLEREDLVYLDKLIQKQIVNRQNNLIIVDVKKWLELFVNEINKSLNNLDSNYNCKYNNNQELVFVKDDNEVKFIANFNKDFIKSGNIINFCFIYSFDFNLHWLDLLNDNNLLDLFCSYLDNEITIINNKQRYCFNFFEGLKDEDISELFHVKIKEYFKAKQFEVLEVQDTVSHLIKKVIRSYEYDSYQVNINEDIIVFVKIDRKIDVLSFKNNSLSYNTSIIREIETLKEKILKKVSEYRKIILFNNNQVIDNTKKTFEVVSVTLTPINAIMLLGTYYGSDKIKEIITNQYVLSSMGIFLIFVLIMIVWLVVVPSIRLNFFNWDIK